VIRSLNFSLTNRCPAQCLFCPANRGQGPQQDLTAELVHKILDEASAPSFPFHVETFQVSENGDALLNKDFLPILRLIREHFPQAWVCIFSNFYLLTRDVAETIFKEKLIQHFNMNLDGHDAASYYAMKKLPLERVLENVHGFLEVRKQRAPETPFTVWVVPAVEYVDAIRKNLHVEPSRLADRKVAPSSFNQVVERFRSEFGSDVEFKHVQPHGWAERQLVDPNEKQQEYACPNIARIENECFIAPNGDWYACCYDSQQELIIGNLAKSTLLELHESPKRRSIIESLKGRRWQEIGRPCNTVKACHSMS